MNVQFARPDVADLMLRVFPRALHPELFDCHGQVLVRTGPFALQIRLCTAGHTLCLRQGERILTEAITEKDQVLPRRQCVLEQKVRGCRTRSVSLPAGLRYDVGCQLEVLDAEVFLRMHEELLADCPSADLAHEYPTGNRFSPSALSLVRFELMQSSAIVHAFHTFPAHCAIVKTQSLLEWE